MNEYFIKSPPQTEYTGIWWLPQRPKQRCTGTLKLSKNSYPQLTLLNGFERQCSVNIGDDVNPIILGLVVPGTFITLHGCYEDGFQSAHIGPTTKTYSVNAAFIRSHFRKVDHIKFQKIWMTYPQLDNWVDIKGAKVTNDFRNHKVSIEYARPESLTFSISDKLRLNIHFRSSFPNNFFNNSMTLNETVIFEIESAAEELSIEEWEKIKSKLEQLFSFFCGRAIYHEELRGVMNSSGVRARQWRRLKQLPIYESTIVVRQPEVPAGNEILFRPEILLELKDVKLDLGNILRRWFQDERLSPITELYAATLYNPRMYLFHRFLTLSGILEIYHRTFVRDHEIDTVDHEARIKRILDAVPNQDRKWVKEKLAFSNSPYLRLRLTEVLSEHAYIVDKMKVDPVKFVQSIVATRNYFTHYSGSLKEKALMGEDLYRATNRLGILVQACFLKELGFSKDQACKILCQRYYN